MKYFLDTEFIEKPGSIQLISIGIIGEDGRTFYAENTSFDEREADEWVWENVIKNLKFWGNQNSKLGFNEHYISLDGQDYELFGTLSEISKGILAFLIEDGNIEFWGYYADYDWVIFCWIFGKMIDLPKGFPMYCRDLKQLLDESKKKKIPNPENEHNALIDAKWNKALYDHLIRD